MLHLPTVRAEHYRGTQTEPSFDFARDERTGGSPATP